MDGEHYAIKLLRTRLNILEHYNSGIDVILKKALDEITLLTQSSIGFFHFVGRDQVTLSLQAWSTRTLNEFCHAQGNGMHYSLDKAGVWADSVRTGKPVIHNDYKSLADKKGLPEGHAILERELVVPVIKNGMVMAIIGVGNKLCDYNENDVETVSFLSDVTWELVSRKAAETEIRKSESMLARAEIVSNSGNWEIDLRKGDVIASEGARRIYGLGNEPLMYDDVKNIPLMKYRESLDNAMSALVKRNLPYDVEFEINAGGGVRYIHSIASYDNENAVIFGTIQDITSRKKDEIALIELNRKLKELNATKDKLFSIIAHDLKSPFSGVMGITDLLIDNLDTYDSQKIRMFLSEISSTTKHTISFLENLLTWAKSQTGQIEFSPENLSVEEIINGISEIFSSQLKIKKISFLYDTCRGKIIFGDRNMVQTIFRNLISNAIKFTHENGRVEILCRENGRGTEVIVKDDGMGMSASIREMLFRINSSFTTSGTNDEKGTGLGLIICREFVERHGGEISVTSEQGGGSEFRFYLPFNNS
ncbi:MAG TPA: ATP-binding protein [Bacteroidales bacterium]|nr:ATP-binding protein [Bacteroidales bacterium]